MRCHSFRVVQRGAVLPWIAACLMLSGPWARAQETVLPGLACAPQPGEAAFSDSVSHPVGIIVPVIRVADRIKAFDEAFRPIWTKGDSSVDRQAGVASWAHCLVAVTRDGRLANIELTDHSAEQRVSER